MIPNFLKSKMKPTAKKVGAKMKKKALLKKAVAGAVKSGTHMMPGGKSMPNNMMPGASK